MEVRGESLIKSARRGYLPWVLWLWALGTTCAGCAEREASPEVTYAGSPRPEGVEETGENHDLVASAPRAPGRLPGPSDEPRPNPASASLLAPRLAAPGAGGPLRQPDGERMQRLRLLMRGEDDEARLALAREILASEERSPLTLHALQALADLDPEAAALELRRMLESAGGDPRARGLLAGAIGMIARNEKALSAEDLTFFFEGGTDDVQLSAARALQSRGDDSLMRRYEEEAAQGLSSPDSRERAEALRRLATMRSSTAKELILPLLSDDDESVRLQALGALHQFGADDDLLARVKAMESDPSERVSQRAARIAESMERRLSFRR